MEPKSIRIDHTFMVNSDVSNELHMLAGDMASPADLTIKCFATGIISLESAFPYYKAELFLEHVINTIGIVPMSRVVVCKLAYGKLYITTSVSKVVFLEWIE